MTNKALDTAKTVNFGIEDLLQESAKVVYEKIFSTRHIGRVLDFLLFEATDFLESSKEPGVCEYRIRNILELSIFNGWTTYRRGEESKCIDIEIGWDKEKFIISAAYLANPDIKNFMPDSAELPESNEPQDPVSKRMKQMLEQIQSLSNGMIVRRDPTSNRVQVIAIIEKEQTAENSDTNFVEVEAMTVKDKPRAGTTYPSALYSNDVKEFLDDERTDAGQKHPRKMQSGIAKDSASRIKSGEVLDSGSQKVDQNGNKIQDSNQNVSGDKEVYGNDLQKARGGTGEDLGDKVQRVNGGEGALGALLNNSEVDDDQTSKREKDLLRVKGQKEVLKDELLKVKGQKEVLKDELLKVKSLSEDKELAALVERAENDKTASDEDLLRVQNPEQLKAKDDASLTMMSVAEDGSLAPMNISDEQLSKELADNEKINIADEGLAPSMQTLNGVDEHIKVMLSEVRQQMFDLFPAIPKSQVAIGFRGISSVINENFMQMVHHVSRLEGIHAIGKVNHYKQKIDQLQTNIEALKLDRDKALEKAGIKSLEASAAKLEGVASETAAPSLLTRENELLIKQSELAFKAKETQMKELLRQKDERIEQQEFMLSKAKESISNTVDTLERTRALASKKIGETEVQAKLISMEKLLDTAKMNNDAMSNRLIDVQQKWLGESTIRSEAQQALSDAEKQIKELSLRLEEKTDATVQRISNELDQKERQVRDLRKRLTDVEKNSIIDQELLRKDKEIENLKSKIAQGIEATEQRLGAELQQKDKLIEQIKIKLAQGAGAAGEFLQKDLDQKNKQIEELKKKLEQSGSVSHFNLQLQQKDREMALLKKQLESGGPYKKEVEKRDKEIDALKKRLEKGGGEIVQALRNELRQKELALDNLEKKMDKTTTGLTEALRKELKAKDQEVAALKTRAEKDEGAKVKALMTDLEKQEQQVKELKKQMESGQGTAARSLKVDVKQKEREVQELNRKVKEAERLKNEARIQMQKQQDIAKKAVDGYKKQITDLQQKLMKATSDIKALALVAGKAKAAAGAGVQDSGVKHKLDQAAKITQATKAELDKVRKRLDETKKSETKLRVELAKVQSQLKVAAKTNT